MTQLCPASAGFFLSPHQRYDWRMDARRIALLICMALVAVAAYGAGGYAVTEKALGLTAASKKEAVQLRQDALSSGLFGRHRDGCFQPFKTASQFFFRNFGRALQHEF